MHNAQFTSFVFVHISKGEKQGLTYCHPYDIFQSPDGESLTEKVKEECMKIIIFIALAIAIYAVLRPLVRKMTGK